MSQFDKLKKMVEELATKNTIVNNNGTQGMVLKGIIWAVKEPVEVEKRKLDTELAKAVLGGDKEKQLQLVEEVKPGSGKLIIHFRLVESIPVVNGTKKIYGTNNTIHHPVARDVKEVEISSDLLNETYLDWKDLEESDVNEIGEQVNLVEITLKNCMLEVTEPIIYRNRIEVPKRVYATVVSAATMQTLGKITWSNDRMSERIKYAQE